ncbi:Guanine nucleotide exchange factor for Cdc42p [Diaporthe eres]
MGHEDETIKQDLAAGIEAAEHVLKKANEAVDRDLLDEALEELVGRVDDWKNHRVEHFGKLLLHGVYTVITGKTEQEKDYEIYLFECILLCCKEITPNKSKDKKDKTKSTQPKMRNKNNKLQLKGRIFMTNVTEVLSFSKPGKHILTSIFPTDVRHNAHGSSTDVSRIIHRANLVEGRSRRGELCDKVLERGDDEEMGYWSRQTTEGERASERDKPGPVDGELQVDGGARRRPGKSLRGTR